MPELHSHAHWSEFEWFGTLKRFQNCRNKIFQNSLDTKCKVLRFFYERLYLRNTVLMKAFTASGSLNLFLSLSLFPPFTLMMMFIRAFWQMRNNNFQMAIPNMVIVHLRISSNGMICHLENIGYMEEREGGRHEQKSMIETIETERNKQKFRKIVFTCMHRHSTWMNGFFFSFSFSHSRKPYLLQALCVCAQ